jgi:hypothetical protein
MIRLFDVQNGVVVPTEHCYTLPTLHGIMKHYPDEFMKIYAYLFYMSCPSPEINPFFDLPEQDKEEIIMREIDADFSLEDLEIIKALAFCRKLYETPTMRAYMGIKTMLDRLATYMGNTPIEHGRDGNINSLVNAAAKFEAIRASFKGAYKDLQEEQKGHTRGGTQLSYDQM